jgi:hypothetical protein
MINNCFNVVYHQVFYLYQKFYTNEKRTNKKRLQQLYESCES